MANSMMVVYSKKHAMEVAGTVGPAAEIISDGHVRLRVEERG